jgi:uncharacterized protein (DUF2384 family)
MKTDEQRVIEAAIELVGDDEHARKWYRTASLRGFGGKSPEAVVEEGGADALIEAIQALVADADL